MPSKPILRFAPSPNGYLHAGHAFSALFTWRAAARLGGAALLRIEDIDPARSKPEFDVGILEDLGWLGITWPEPVWRQSQRLEVYREAARQVGDLLYPCTCSRAEIAARCLGTDPDGVPLYDGHCRVHGPVAGRPMQWRLRMDEALGRVGAPPVAKFRVEGIDIVSGAAVSRPSDPAAWGDAVIVRKEVPTSYHLSVVVDDAAQGVTHVTRGMDLYRATDLHVLLQALLGLPSPVYAHHALVRDETDRKLGKSRGSLALRDLRAQGVTPAVLRQRLGYL